MILQLIYKKKLEFRSLVFRSASDEKALYKASIDDLSKRFLTLHFTLMIQFDALSETYIWKAQFFLS